MLRVVFVAWVVAWAGHGLVAIVNPDIGFTMYRALGYVAPVEVAILLAMVISWRDLLPRTPDLVVLLVAAGVFSSALAAYYWSWIAAGGSLLIPILAITFA